MIHGNMDALATGEGTSAPSLDYTISGKGPYRVHREGHNAPATATNRSDVLYEVNRDVVVQLQKLNSDLFFLHSAAIAWQGRASLLVAESGGGKSTTTWALLHHGYDYLSDEMAPIALDTRRVLPYPRALCLKRSPPPSYPLPAETIRLTCSLHVPTRALPARVITEGCPLDAIFLLRYDPTAREPSLRRITAAEATARLFVHALNALAHPNMGLDAVLHIVSHARCFDLTTARLPETCELIGSALKGTGPHI